MLLLCLFFLPPIWAKEARFVQEILLENTVPVANPYQEEVQEEPQEEISEEAEEPPQEQISLFDEQIDENATPFSSYDRNAKVNNFLKGGVKFYEDVPKTLVSKDNYSIIAQKDKNTLFAVSGQPVNGNDQLFWGYKNSKFSIFHSFERVTFKSELERSNNALESEVFLNKNFKLRTSLRGVQAQHGYTQGVTLEYGKKDSRFKKINNLKLELKATTTVKQDANPVRRFGFNTRYYF